MQSRGRKKKCHLKTLRSLSIIIKGFKKETIKLLYIKRESMTLKEKSDFQFLEALYKRQIQLIIQVLRISLSYHFC